MISTVALEIIVRKIMIDLTFIILYSYFIKCIIVDNTALGIVGCSAIMAICSIRHIIFTYKIKRIRKICKKKLNKQKEKFIEILTHDLKVPAIAQFRGLEILQKSINGESHQLQNELIIDLQDSCKHILNMISMFVDIHKYETYSYEPHYEHFYMTNLISECIQELLRCAKEKNLTFSYKSNIENSGIIADKSQVKNLLINLIMNAIIYTKNDGIIEIKTNYTDEKLTFSISSNDMFGYESIDTKYTTVGQKIGLTMCKKIIEFHKGKIYMFNDNNTPSVIFTIPRNISQAAENTPLYG